MIYLIISMNWANLTPTNTISERRLMRMTPRRPSAHEIASRQRARLGRSAGDISVDQATSMIFPRCVDVSISSCAFAASASGNSECITGRTRPASSNGQTLSLRRAAIAAFSSIDRGRSVEPVNVSRFNMICLKRIFYDFPWVCDNVIYSHATPLILI